MVSNVERRTRRYAIHTTYFASVIALEKPIDETKEFFDLLRVPILKGVDVKIHVRARVRQDAAD